MRRSTRMCVLSEGRKASCSPPTTAPTARLGSITAPGASPPPSSLFTSRQPMTGRGGSHWWRTTNRIGTDGQHGSSAAADQYRPSSSVGRRCGAGQRVGRAVVGDRCRACLLPCFSVWAAGESARRAATGRPWSGWFPNTHPTPHTTHVVSRTPNPLQRAGRVLGNRETPLPPTRKTRS